MRGHKHTLQTSNDALEAKGLSLFLKVIDIDEDKGLLTVRDTQYGVYAVDLKALSPKTAFPLHRLRVHKNRLDAAAKKYVGAVVNGLTIKSVFYGPDRGYKNKSFYVEYLGECGHQCIDSYSSLSRHRKKFKCRSCAKTTHGERSLVDGVRRPRSNTYVHWQRTWRTLPEKYHNFEAFRAAAGDKPYQRADVILVDDIPVWVNLDVTDETEINLMAVALRQAFRRSIIFKSAVAAARVETEDGPRYRCASCNTLARRKDIQVDHIDPIMHLSGEPLRKEELIDRIWTTGIQILDRGCHAKKSAAENKIRKENKKKKDKYT